MAKKSPTEFEVKLSGFSRIEREAIAVEIIDRIKERTRKDNIDKNGRAFPKYSREYAKSDNFKIAGKSKSKINLTLSGDMLDSLEVIKNRSGVISVGYSNDNPEQGKAEGNILGTYGQSESTGKKRDFLGLPKYEIENILKKYKRDEKRAEKILQEVESADILSGEVDIEDLDGEG